MKDMKDAKKKIERPNEGNKERKMKVKRRKKERMRKKKGKTK